MTDYAEMHRKALASIDARRDAQQRLRRVKQARTTLSNVQGEMTASDPAWEPLRIAVKAATEAIGHMVPKL